jgi:hypothetical protein
MKNTLFIGATAIKERTAVHSNIDDKSILPEIKTAQDMYILPALGTALYTRLQDGIVANNLTANESALLDDYVTDTLVYYVLSELPVGLSFQFYNKGLVRKTSDNSDQPNMQDLIDVANRYRSRAEFYKQRMIKYLQEVSTTNLFPEYINPGTGIDTMYPEKDGYQSSIFLGDENSLFGMSYPQHVLKSKKNYNY